jgi:hypothetical protein
MGHWSGENAHDRFVTLGDLIISARIIDEGGSVRQGLVQCDLCLVHRYIFEVLTDQVLVLQIALNLQPKFFRELLTVSLRQRQSGCCVFRRCSRVRFCRRGMLHYGRVSAFSLVLRAGLHQLSFSASLQGGRGGFVSLLCIAVSILQGLFIGTGFYIIDPLLRPLFHGNQVCLAKHLQVLRDGRTRRFESAVNI